MRRFTNPAVFKHSHRPVLSFEEYQVVKAEAAQDLAEIQADESEAERAMDTADSLEDLVAVADTVDSATPTEVALVQVAGDIATAGTNMTSEEIVPVGESYIGRSIATEGIVDTVKKIWAAIKKFVKDVWAKVTSWFNKFFGTLPNLRKRIEALRKRLEEIQSGGYKLEGDNKKFTLTNVAAVSVNNSPIKDSKGIINALGVHDDSDMASIVKESTKGFNELLDDFDKVDLTTYKGIFGVADGISKAFIGFGDVIKSKFDLNDDNKDSKDRLTLYNFNLLGNSSVYLSARIGGVDINAYSTNSTGKIRRASDEKEVEECKNKIKVTLPMVKKFNNH